MSDRRKEDDFVNSILGGQESTSASSMGKRSTAPPDSPHRGSTPRSPSSRYSSSRSLGDHNSVVSSSQPPVRTPRSARGKSSSVPRSDSPSSPQQQAQPTTSTTSRLLLDNSTSLASVLAHMKSEASSSSTATESTGLFDNRSSAQAFGSDRSSLSRVKTDYGGLSQVKRSETETTTSIAESTPAPTDLFSQDFQFQSKSLLSDTTHSSTNLYTEYDDGGPIEYGVHGKERERESHNLHALSRAQSTNAPLEKHSAVLAGGGEDSPPSSPTSNSAGTPTPSGSKRQSSRRGVAVLLPYALLFINFTLNTSGILLMMAGFVTRKNSAITLCNRCSHLTIAPIVVGAFLWLMSTFAFNWFHKKNLILLLGYAASLVVVVISLMAMLTVALVFDRANYQNIDLLNNWKQAVVKDPASLCVLQERFNCSGYQIPDSPVPNCCRSSSSHFNPTLNFSAAGSGSGVEPASDVCFGDGPIPDWALAVCPRCPHLILNNTNVCTDIVYRTMRRNLVGFSVIVGLAVLLITLGLLMALLTRKHRQKKGKRGSAVPLLVRDDEHVDSRDDESVVPVRYSYQPQ